MPIILKAPNGNEIQTYALLDSGSQISLVRKDISDKLGLKGKRCYISVGTIKNEPEKISVSEIKLCVLSQSRDVQIEVDNAYAIPKSSFKMPARSSFSGSFEDVEVMNFPSIRENQVGMLIGANVPEAMIIKEIKRSEVGKPVLARTVFGWTVFGAENPGHKREVTVSLLRAEKNIVSLDQEELLSEMKSGKLVTERDELEKDTELSEQLERFWKQESTGFTCSNRQMSGEDTEALGVLKKGTRFVG